MRMGTDHNQMMNELEKQSRLLEEIRNLLKEAQSTMRPSDPYLVDGGLSNLERDAVLRMRARKLIK